MHAIKLRRMQSALGLGEAAPAAGAVVFSRIHRAGARPAADAGVALIVQGIVGDVVVGDELPDHLLRPVRERTDLHQAELFIPADDGGVRQVCR